MPSRPRSSLAASLLGLCAGLLARVWLATLRVRTIGAPGLVAVSGRPWVYAFWHGTQWPLLAWRRRGPTVVLVSLSRDGAIQARALALQGMTVVRGSTTREGARGLAALIRTMRVARADAAFAVDGPRGPYGKVKDGVVVAARATGAVIIPMTGVVYRGFVLRRAWDRFGLAWPFSRVDVLLGAPIDPARSQDAGADLQRTLDRLNAHGREKRRGSPSRAADRDGVDFDERSTR